MPQPPIHLPRASRAASFAQSRRFTLLLVLALIACTALLAACTRDRPTPEGSETGATTTVGNAADSAAAAAPAQDAAPAAATDDGGEPEAVISEVVTSTVGEGTLAPGAITYEEIEVASGDTLASLAFKYDTTVDEIRTLNKLQSDMIPIGLKLRVPIKPAEPTPTPEPYLYMVVAGDTLSGIASRFGVPMPQIVLANKLPDASALRVGMDLIIPGYAPAATEEGDAAASGDGAATAANAAANGGAQATHSVRAGETLSEIAALYGLKTGDLQRANNLASANNIRPGQVLTLPGLTVDEALAAISTKHTVAVGETLSQIAKQYGVSVADIVRVNNLASANTIRPGQVLTIPPPSN